MSVSVVVPRHLLLPSTTATNSTLCISSGDAFMPKATIPFPVTPFTSKTKVLFTTKRFPPIQSQRNPRNPSSSFVKSLPFLAIFTIFIFLRFLLSLLPLDFSDRWHRLLVISAEAESRSGDFPSHLIHAIVASEDRLFFRHIGIDPIGVARAVVYFPNSGGGSTITQQLVKNIFLKSERKISRKVIEMVLALILERRMSKRRILLSYLSKIYWGHGIYGIESASLFYFGKHPSLLTLEESAVLAGILPAPDLLSPFKDPNRGKLSQARALKKMVAAGFLDIETAFGMVIHPLCLHANGLENASRRPCNPFFKEELRKKSQRRTLKSSTMKNIWDWENASRLWEANEYLEKWAAKNKMSTKYIVEK